MTGCEPTLECPPRLAVEWQEMAGQRPIANRPDNLHLCLFRHFKCVIHLDAEVPNCTFKFRVTEQQLNSPEVLRATIDQRRLGPAHRVSTVTSVVKAD
jgi:hypothetical protein